MNWELDEALDAEALLFDEYAEANTVTIDKGGGVLLHMLDGEIVGVTCTNRYPTPPSVLFPDLRGQDVYE